jgi:Spy/CpxP family protein refolding chaperone
LKIQIRDNNKKFEETVNGFLTPEQKTKLTELRAGKKDKVKAKKDADGIEIGTEEGL